MAKQVVGHQESIFHSSALSTTVRENALKKEELKVNHRVISILWLAATMDAFHRGTPVCLTRPLAAFLISGVVLREKPVLEEVAFRLQRSSWLQPLGVCGSIGAGGESSSGYRETVASNQQWHHRFTNRPELWGDFREAAYQCPS